MTIRCVNSPDSARPWRDRVGVASGAARLGAKSRKVAQGRTRSHKVAQTLCLLIRRTSVFVAGLVIPKDARIARSQRRDRNQGASGAQTEFYGTNPIDDFGGITVECDRVKNVKNKIDFLGNEANGRFV